MLGRIANAVEALHYLKRMPSISCSFIPAVLQNKFVSLQHAESLFEYSTSRKRDLAEISRLYLQKCAQIGDTARIARGVAVMEREGLPIDFEWLFLVNSSSSDTQHMMQELKNYQEKGFTPTGTTYLRIIQHYLRKRDFCAALRVCDEMKLRAHGAAEIAQVFHARTLVHSERGDPAACAHELAQMDAQGIPRDETVYLRLLEAHVRAGNLASARGVLEEMHAGGFVVNNVAHCALLSAYAQKGDLRAVSQLVEEMRAQGMRPSVLAYTHWIDALCAAQDIRQSLRVLVEMRGMEKNVPLEIWAKILEKAWDEKKARSQVYENIKQEGNFPTEMVYLVLMELAEYNQNWDRVLELAQDLRARGGAMDHALYEKVATAHAKRGNAETWLRTVNEARARGFHLHVSQELFLTFAHENVTTCARLYEMLKEGLDPSEKMCVRAHEAMAEMWVRAGSAQNALRIVEQIKNEGTLPSAELTDKIIQELYKKGKWDSCVQIFQEMRRTDTKPLDSTREAMIGVYGMKKDLKEARRLWAESEKGAVGNAMVFAYTACGDQKNAIQLFREMKREGTQMKELAYVAMVSIFGKRGEMGEVERLYEEVLENKIEHGERLNNALLGAYTVQGMEREREWIEQGEERKGNNREREEGGKKGNLGEFLKRHGDKEEVRRFAGVLRSLKIVF
eukprot:Phypoly_transcript_04262.p1 GENE.Phypoly_transcript_04262~~Phypoly_transcript_04262.p1  ORF type:complete len:678 (+),score=164.33 Phypoly_transcript_04262:55-2088(+)